MNFLALLLGLGVERTLTHLFHLREFRWLDPLFDLALRRAATESPGSAAALLGLFAVVLAAPVALGEVALAGTFVQVPAFLFAVAVLLFSLGPRDLEEEAEEYFAAVEAGEPEGLRRLARELTEQDAPGEATERDAAVARAICVQANNRVFGVVFWFLVSGPAGAWLFRVADLMRRRAAFAHPPGSAARAARLVHGVLAWVPARLMAAGFALVGSFDGALAAWRAAPADPAAPFPARTEDLVERVGRGAAEPAESPATAAGPRAALALARRTLWLIWYPAIALLTLNDVLL